MIYKTYPFSFQLISTLLYLSIGKYVMGMFLQGIGFFLRVILVETGYIPLLFEKMVGFFAKVGEAQCRFI